MYLNRSWFNHTYSMANKNTRHPVHQTTLYAVTDTI